MSLTKWTPALRKAADEAIDQLKTDREVAAVLRAKGLGESEALFRTMIRRSRMMRNAIESGDHHRADKLANSNGANGAPPTVDEATIRALVKAAADELPAQTPAPAPAPSSTTTIKVELPDGATRKIEGAHHMMPRLLKLLGAGFPVYLWGPAGTGKTTAGLMAAKALGRDAEIDTLDPSTFRSMVQGYRTPEGEPVHTGFTRCWTEGKTYVADEADNAPGHVQTLFNSALANGQAPLAWGCSEKAEGFHFVGTGNTPGRPTRSFPDRRPMSEAFRDRLYFVHFPLDPAIECKAAGLPVPPPPKRDEITCTPAEWGTWVQTAREYCDEYAPTIQVTARATLQGIKALAIGETPEEIANGLVFRGCDDELRRKVLAACPLPGRKVGKPETDTKPETKPETDADVAAEDGPISVVVSNTDFRDYECRRVLNSFRCRWHKSRKVWTGTVSQKAIDTLRSRGATVEVQS